MTEYIFLWELKLAELDKSLTKEIWKVLVPDKN